MKKKEKLIGINKQLSIILDQVEVASFYHDSKSCMEESYEELDTLITFFNDQVWGNYMNDGLVEDKAMKFSRCFPSYARLVNVIRGWNPSCCWHCLKLLNLIFSHNMLGHLDHEEMAEWVKKLDDVLEGITYEEYILHEDEGKRDVHMALFYLNACAKIMLSAVSEEEKWEMYDMLDDYETYKTIKIVASIYYNSPWPCSSLSDMCSVAGSLINKKKEHYASIFLIAERYARHHRNCVFEWRSKKNNFYNMMVSWSKEKEQRTELVGILSIIFPKVEDWEPAHNSFHPMRFKLCNDEPISPIVKDYVDAKSKQSMDYADKKYEESKKKWEETDRRSVDNSRRCDENGRRYDVLKERMMDGEMLNQKAHMDLSERIGKVSGGTVHVGNGGVYNKNVNNQNLIGADAADENIQKGIGL